MNRYLSKAFAIVVVIAVVFGLVAALVPATAEAAGPGGHAPRYYPQYSHYGGGSARWSSPQPKVIVRDNGADCDWWGYVRTPHGYKRFYTTCCRFGNATRDYAVNPRQVWNNP